MIGQNALCGYNGVGRNELLRFSVEDRLLPGSPRRQDVDTHNMKATGFCEHFIEENELGRCDFRDWVLLPGMLFQASEEWWGERRSRRTPHEGLDLCYYRDRHNRLHTLDENTRIPAMYDGVVVGIIDDLLGKSLVVHHGFADTDTTRFCTIYGHTVPGDDICIGRSVRQGEAIATVASALKSTSTARPHVHISAGMLHAAISWCDLDWQLIGSPDTMTLVDPLQLIGKYCLVPGTPNVANCWQEGMLADAIVCREGA